MSGIAVLLDQGDRAALAEQLRQHWLEGRTTAVVSPQERAQLERLLAAPLPQGVGAALVLGTGGSTGGRQWCLQPLAHLQRAARATAASGSRSDSSRVIRVSRVPRANTSTRCRPITAAWANRTRARAYGSIDPLTSRSRTNRRGRIPR